jgi:spore coat protein U-like protein
VKQLIASAAAGLALLAPATAWAVMTCSIGSATDVAFGSYDVFGGSPVDSSGTISYVCSDVGGADSIVIHLSKGSSTTYSPRTLVSGLYELSYNLYLEASRSSIWGNGTAGTSEYGPLIPLDGVSTDVTVYGRIPAGQNAFVGIYSDTVVVTLVF